MLFAIGEDKIWRTCSSPICPYCHLWYDDKTGIMNEHPIDLLRKYALKPRACPMGYDKDH